MRTLTPSAGHGSSAGRTRRTRVEARQAILNAAGAAFSEGGYDSTSLDEIARRVGVTRTGVLYHFPSKEDVLAGLITPLLADVDALLARVEAADEPTPEQRRAVVDGMFDNFVRHPHASDLLARFQSTVATLDIGPAVMRYNEQLAVRLGGAAYHTDLDVRLRVATAIAAVRGLMSSRLPIDLRRRAERQALVDIVEGILTR
jgi:AcrR family transcriptional regulator